MIYGHPAPCLVTLIDGGPTVMVEPLRFIPLSELPIPSWSQPKGTPGGSAVTCSPGEQMRAASTPRGSGRRRPRHVLSEHHFIG